MIFQFLSVKSRRDRSFINITSYGAISTEQLWTDKRQTCQRSYTELSSVISQLGQSLLFLKEPDVGLKLLICIIISERTERRIEVVNLLNG